MIKLSHFINGAHAQPRDDVEWLPIYNPALGEVIGHIPNATQVDVDLAVTAAKHAFASWSKVTATERSRLLNRVADILESKIEQFALAESRDQGKTLAFATRVWHCYP
jgi:aminomuconate-semialdehyde/2-hydroxymuconate-6-semialdehyde dehydrogenase